MVEAYIQIMKRNKLFDGIGNTDMKALLGCLNYKLMDYNKNEYIATEGENFDSIGIILKGTAAVLKEDINGNRVIMVMLKPGDMFGEMAAFSNNPVWPANVQVQENCKVCFLPASKIVSACAAACQWHTVLIINILKTISEKALNLNRKVEYLAIKSMRGRISTFLMEQYKKTGKTEFKIPMDRNELAEFLNVSRPSMSREMSRMRDECIIAFHKNEFRLIDLEALKLS